MKRTLVVVMVIMFALALLAGCGGDGGGGGSSSPALTGKYMLVSMVDSDGNDWLEFLLMMSEMADEGDEFDLDSMYIEFTSNDKFMMAMDEDGPVEGAYKVDGNSITLSVDGDEISGTVEGNKITLKEEEDGESMTMVFEKK